MFLSRLIIVNCCCFCCSYVDTFGPVLKRFEDMGLADNTFIITSTIGQEMNSAGSAQTALPILKAAEAVGTDNSKLMWALQAALGTAYWRNGNQVSLTQPLLWSSLQRTYAVIYIGAALDLTAQSAY